ncbi:hypothetical protein FOL46_001328 [Perkinsus olseni]|uniref:CCHC-type domain-containing protein n=1 Tax=Perkinsus olseni TaxID=32597 RepID=A0A7J6MDB9_PEROL|nr:hypothetical protein FOL46_001328 [Perkinsus olseni]
MGQVIATVLEDLSDDEEKWKGSQRATTLHRIFRRLSSGDLWAIYRRYRRQELQLPGLDQEQTREVLGPSLGVGPFLFIWDIFSIANSHVDPTELLCMASIFSGSELSEKGRFLLAVFDTSGRGMLTPKSLCMMGRLVIEILGKCVPLCSSGKSVYAALRKDVASILPGYSEALAVASDQRGNAAAAAILFETEEMIGQMELTLLLAPIKPAYDALPLSDTSAAAGRSDGTDVVGSMPLSLTAVAVPASLQEEESHVSPFHEPPSSDSSVCARAETPVVEEEMDDAKVEETVEAPARSRSPPVVSTPSMPTVTAARPVVEVTAAVARDQGVQTLITCQVLDELLDSSRHNDDAHTWGPASVDPRPASVDPGPVSVDPGPVSVDPGPVSVDPGPVSVEPGPVSVDPGPVSVEPGPVSVVGSIGTIPASTSSSCSTERRSMVSSDGIVASDVSDENAVRREVEADLAINVARGAALAAVRSLRGDTPATSQTDVSEEITELSRLVVDTVIQTAVGGCGGSDYTGGESVDGTSTTSENDEASLLGHLVYYRALTSALISIVITESQPSSVLQYLSLDDKKKLQQDLLEHGIHHACRGIKVGADGGTCSNVTAAIRRQVMLPQGHQQLRGSGRDEPHRAPTVCRNCGLTGHWEGQCGKEPVCYNCRRSGHRVNDCPVKERICRRCRRPGHEERDCRHPPRCILCDKDGHWAGDCPTKDVMCLNCRELGHRAKDCPNDIVCIKCRRPGHKVADCPTLRGDVVAMDQEDSFEFDRRREYCLNCKSYGHFSRGCPNEPVCNACGMEGHIAVNCPRTRRVDENGRGGWSSPEEGRSDRVSNDDEVCLNCKRPGHIARECPNEIVCNKCGGPGHKAYECPEGEERSPRKRPLKDCYICGELGHIAAECPNDGIRDHRREGDGRRRQSDYGRGMASRMPSDDELCYNCHQRGHIARDCRKPPICRNCHREGHIAQNCPSSRPEHTSSEHVVCRNCRQTGHLTRDCHNPPVCNSGPLGTLTWCKKIVSGSSDRHLHSRLWPSTSDDVLHQVEAELEPVAGLTRGEIGYLQHSHEFPRFTRQAIRQQLNVDDVGRPTQQTWEMSAPMPWGRAVALPKVLLRKVALLVRPAPVTEQEEVYRGVRVREPTMTAC